MTPSGRCSCEQEDQEEEEEEKLSIGAFLEQMRNSVENLHEQYADQMQMVG